jgi:hypothetical protein
MGDVYSFDPWALATAVVRDWIVYREGRCEVGMRQYQPPNLTAIGEGATTEEAERAAVLKLAQMMAARRAS